jgi:hypothetical protein
MILSRFRSDIIRRNPSLRFVLNESKDLGFYFADRDRVDAFGSGILQLFNVALSKRLLYGFERGQVW